MKYLTKWLNENWTFGQYTPSESFKQITNHSCVCKPNLEMISLSGRADDEEAQKQSEMFAASPEAFHFIVSLVDMYEMGVRPDLGAHMDHLNQILKKAGLK